MDPYVSNFAQVAIIVVLLVGSLSTIGVLTNRAILRAKRKESTQLAVDDERLEQLQQSVDAIAVEVERIAEAQRFTAKLMARRAESQPLPR